MTVTVTHRKTCRLCDSKNVELVVKLDPIPLSENYCADSEIGKQAARYPVDLYMCADCGHVQQLDVVDSKSLWERDRKSTRLNSSHSQQSRMPSSA